MRLRLLLGLVPVSLIIAGCGAGGSASSGSPSTSVTTSVSPAAPASPAVSVSPAASDGTFSRDPVVAQTAGQGSSGLPASVQARLKAISGPCSAPVAAAADSGISGIQFTSRDQGWAVGASSILATTDGGRHWTVQLSGPLNLTSVDFINGQDGWAVGTSRLLATTDGGAHWSALTEPCLTIRSVHFISAAIGFAVAGGTGPALPMLSGVVLVTADGGRNWRELSSAPAGTQTVCFSDARDGWAGAGGMLYRTSDGGVTWARLTRPVAEDGGGYPAAMSVECASDGTAWALSSGPGAGMSQQEHVGYYGTPSGVTGLFAEQTMQAAGTGPTRPSPGSDPGPFSAINSSEAVFIDACTACGMGTAPWDLVSGAGATLTREGNVADITAPEAASFLSPEVGWVAGADVVATGTARSQQRIMATTNGGRTWVTQWAGPWTNE